MRITRKIAIPVITAAAIMGTGGIAYASVTPTDPPTITNPINPVNPFPTDTPTVNPFPTNFNPTPGPIRNRRFCNVQFDRIAVLPSINPITGLRIRVGQWDRVCFSRSGGVTVTALSNPVVF